MTTILMIFPKLWRNVITRWWNDNFRWWNGNFRWWNAKHRWWNAVPAEFNHCLTRSLLGQFFTECHPQVGFSFAGVPAGYVLWCLCTAELHALNDEYTRQWHLTMYINWRDNSSAAVNVLRLHLETTVTRLNCLWQRFPDRCWNQIPLAMRTSP